MHIKDNLKDKLDNIPNQPGVYLFKNSQKKVIYVGKAKRLRPRVRSYFQKGRNEGPKFSRLVKQINDLEFIITDSEIEALILEANLVKEYKPRYNVNLKDDKSFPFIRVTNEKYPRVFPTRKIIKDGSRYFGPYTDVRSMRALLKSVQRLFPIRTCGLNLTSETIAEKKFKVCLNYHIHRCYGPCEGLIGEDEYADIVQRMISFINGRDRIVIEELQRKMESASENMEFEKAARLRDQLDAIKDFQYKQKVTTTEDIDQDMLTVHIEDDDASGVIFKIREGRIIGRQHYYLSGVDGEPLGDVLKNFLMQYYLKADFIPREIYLPARIADAAHVHEWLRQRANGRVDLKFPQRGEKAKLLKMATHNAKLLLQELKLQKLKSKDYIPHSVKALQQALRLKTPPRRIEAFDISNTSGTNPTASLVTFVNGQPQKKEYRHFRIRAKSTPDDYTMMTEAVHRRYHRILKEESVMPDLILVDGGKGQLSAALSALKKLKIKDQPIIALAKRLDEVFVPGVSDPQNIPRDSSGLRLLQRVRDEAHRFAVSYHRKLRGKSAVHSELDDIPGVGETRRKRLIKHFGSLKNLRNATEEEIRSVRGIPENLAHAIYQHFKDKTR
ncbi:MAG: excinuclease ABC subunit UvrC [candidate division KSB1 bacterium]|nr:excinuclease ABC subunit UvrC [candidate division KSB1 bacterium]